MPTPKHIYDSCKIAETKHGFREHGYAEYLNGLYYVNDFAAAIVELYEENQRLKQNNPLDVILEKLNELDKT